MLAYLNPMGQLEDRGDEDPETIIRENGRLFLRNLPFDSTQEELQERFSKYGPISEVGHSGFIFPIPLSSKRMIMIVP